MWHITNVIFFLCNRILLTGDVACATTKKNKPSRPKPPQLNSFLEAKENEEIKRILNVYFTVTVCVSVCVFLNFIAYLTFVVDIWPLLRKRSANIPPQGTINVIIKCGSALTIPASDVLKSNLRSMNLL